MKLGKRFGSLSDRNNTDYRVPHSFETFEDLKNNNKKS